MPSIWFWRTADQLSVTIKSAYIANLRETEVDMGALEVMTLFFQIMGGLGLFFTGVGVLWFVTVYKGKK